HAGVGVFARDGESNVAAVGCVLRRVVEQIGQQLCQSHLVGPNLQRFIRDVDSQVLPPAVYVRARDTDGVADGGDQWDRLQSYVELALGDAGQIVEVVDHARQVSGLVTQNLDEERLGREGREGSIRPVHQLGCVLVDADAARTRGAG